ncbi:MAG: nicotinamide-nucleotide amidohydrolase family protein [Candidatus Omnitrophica bacterium]|nr:nicotinamide-nucleotide amidohydrolase family protein [Candidatus Omnitrophota bacterium]
MNSVSKNSKLGRQAARPEEKILLALKKSRKTLALAESCTGGLVAHRMTNVPGASASFKGGIVSYSDGAKTDLLNVPPDVIGEHGAVSRQTARAMAEGARRVLKADMAAAITGIAGPGGGSARKPVGLAYIAFSSEDGDRTKKIVLDGNRISLKLKFAQAVIDFIRENV